MKRSEQHLQGYRHGWREAIAYVLAHAAEMNDPSAQAALRACAHGMGVRKHESKVKPVEYLDEGLAAGISAALSGVRCPKCGAESGDDWRQCNGACPMSMSPHFHPNLTANAPNNAPAARVEYVDQTATPYLDLQFSKEGDLTR